MKNVAERARRTLDTNHDTWPSKAAGGVSRVDYSIAKGNTIKEREREREQLKSNESPHLNFFPFAPSLFLSLFLSLILSVCPSTYLPVHLYLSPFLRLPFRWPFGPLHRPSIKVPRRARTQVHRCTSAGTWMSMCVHNPSGSFPC